MKPWHKWVPLLVSVLSLGLTAKANSASIRRSRWTAHSAGFHVYVTSRDILAGKDGSRDGFSVRRFALAQQRIVTEAETDPNPGRRDVLHRYRVLSLAGPLLAIRDDAEICRFCMLPTGYARFWTIDLRRPMVFNLNREEPLRTDRASRGALVDLRDLVPEQQIADAIAATPLGAAGPDSPKSRDLTAVLYDVAQRGLGQTEDTCFTADEAVSSSFGITSVDRTGVRVTLGLSAPPSCKYNLKTIDIRVQVPGKLTRLLAGNPVVLAPQELTPVGVFFGSTEVH